MDLAVLPGFDARGEVDAVMARRVAQALRAGGIVGLPTETVYGLAADAQDADAVARIYEAKGRPADHPLIVHVAGPAALAGWSARPNHAAVRLAEVFWPGPLTVVVARSERAEDFVTGGQGTVALRCPAHPVARACIQALAEAAGDAARGVAAPSANRFGRVSPTRAEDVVAEVGDRLDPLRDLVVDGGPCAVGVESTIVDCTVDSPRVLRLGAISQAHVDAALAEGRRSGDVGTDAAGTAVGAPGGEVGRRRAQPGPAVAMLRTDPGDGRRGAEVRAPGTLQSHYAPRAQVVLIDPASGDHVRDPRWLQGRPEVTTIRRREGGFDGRGVAVAQGAGVGLIAPDGVPTPAGWVRLLAAADARAYARDLYAALRRADELGLDTVAAVLPDPSGGPLATAVRDRLTRAAHRD